jgi:hypothetical protein
LPDYEITLVSSRYKGTNKQRLEEARKLNNFRNIRVDLFNARKSESSDLDRLQAELRHYDSLSYFSLVAAFLVVAYAHGLATEITISNYSEAYRGMKVLPVLAASVILVLLYRRLANTAGSARRSLEAISFYLSRGGLHSSQATHGSIARHVKVPSAILALFIFGWSAVVAELFI